MAALNQDNFCVEAAIADFRADAARSSLELPQMTTGQRKHAKKVADQYPELSCVSYGLGQDRRLHLFKQGESSCADQVVSPAKESEPCLKEQGLQRIVRAVSVRNTFIDDWVAGEVGDYGAEPIASRSMPPRLRETVMDSCILEDSVCDHGSASQSTAPSSCGSSIASPSPRSSDQEHAPLPYGISPPPGLEVRNTFIHFEDGSVDERIVQSMPHDMFRQCLLAEVLSDLSGRAASIGIAELPVTVTKPMPAAIHIPAPLYQKAPVSGFPIAPGTEVVIDGLSKLPAFNGISGSVQSLDTDSGRYNILLSSPTCGHKFAKVKADNLLIVVPPPPPCFAPGLSIEQCESPSWEGRDVQPLSLAALV